MKLNKLLFAFSLTMAPISQGFASSTNHPPVELSDLFAERRDVRSTLDLQLIEEEIADILIQTNLSSENQVQIQLSILKVIDEAQKNNVPATWNATLELRDLCLEIKAQQGDENPRIIFDIIGSIFSLISSVLQLNFLGVIEAIFDIISLFT